MSKLRFRVVETAFKKKAVEVATPVERPSEYFAKYVFNKEKMFKYLPSKVYNALIDAIDNGAPLDRSIADEVAAGMKKWATEMGVTHYTHWFAPLTEGTAEKHDAFVEHDGKGGMMEEFTGKLLVQQEPDASSFPNGGIRNTFEARGYSAWDPSSPAFIVDDTLCIPTVFIAYTGEALDYKAPLLKALRAVDKAAVDVCHYFNPEVKKVVAYLGWEQEYFLVDEGLYAARPDLLMTGRTLMGHDSEKELEARNEVKWETYTKKIQIEARVLGDLAMNHIIPVATQYQTDLINNVYKMQSLFPAEKAAKLSAKNLELIEEIADRTAFIKEHVDAMVEARKVANKIESEREKAIAYHDTITPALEEIRYHIDKLELIVDNQMWTLPKYRELLFVR